MTEAESRGELILVLAPTGRDAALIVEEFNRHQMSSRICSDLDTLCSEIVFGAGMVLVAEEALPPASLTSIIDALRRQPPWSDLPLVILTGRGAPSTGSVRRFEALDPIANVTQLERPVRTRTLVSAARSALRARRRQYDVRDYLDERDRLLAEVSRQAEALAEADRRKDDFLALLAHELRNPLAPIRNGLQVLRLAQDGVTRARSQMIMDRQLAHMVRLVDDLLDVSRITRGKMELRRQQVTLADAVSHAVETARPMLDSAQHELIIDLPTEPVLLDADLTRLAQVFANLLTNSAKYTDPRGKIWLTARVHPESVVVTVKDTGIGIPSQALSTLFDMFTQVDRINERSTGGLGLGLSLVKGLTEMHGGSVSATSDGQGCGSTFTITLPLLAADGTPKVCPFEATPRSRISRRILVVDDNQDSAESMAEMLRLLGDVVSIAHDGLEAVEAAEREQPEVILMDVGMPRLDGLAAARRIRAQPWGQDAVVIALTGWGQDGDRAKTKEAGCDGHLVKPVDLGDLEKLLASLTEERHRASNIGTTTRFRAAARQ